MAIAFVDRFGRNDVEGIRAFDELTKLGITVQVATYPNLDANTPDGRMIVGMLFTVARFESDRIGQRCKEGMLTKLLEGGWAWRAPDGYLNIERKSNQGDHTDKLQNARYKHWVEKDPVQSKVWREAWDLLLEDRYTLDEIAEKLHAKGYRMRSGAPFVKVSKSGKRKPRRNGLSRVFHNWFYAGWVVVDTDWARIWPGEVRGQWEPIVSTEEFKAGLRILEQRRNNHNHRHRHFYLLQGRIYLQNNDQLHKLGCSTPNAGRDGGGTPYYCIPSSEKNFLCSDVDAQVADWLHAIQVDGAEIPALRKAYLEDIKDKLSRPEMNEQRKLETALRNVNEEEMRAARLYAAGKISDETWDTLWQEWHDHRSAIKASLESLDRKSGVYIDSLDAALSIIAKLGILYKKLDRHSQQAVLKHVVNRVIIDATGTIITMDLRPPFTYLHALHNGGSRSSGASSGAGKTKTSSAETACSTYASFGTLHSRFIEHTFDTPGADELIYFVNAIAYPQRKAVEKFLTRVTKRLA